MNICSARLAWGILGTGGIANTFAEGLSKSQTGKLVAVASRKQESANEFAAKFGVEKAYGSYETLLRDPNVQVVYISTPHPLHSEWCIKAAEAKKHVLCEKPLTMNHAEALIVANAAKKNGVFLMEDFAYRCHPQTARLVELIRSGIIGKIGVIRATYSSQVPFNPCDRRFDPDLGGGGILDLGCYTTSIARLIAGAAHDQPFLNPVKLQAFAEFHPETGVDIYSVATAQFEGGILAQLVAGVGLKMGSCLQIYGTTGYMEVPKPFIMARNGGLSSILVTRYDLQKTDEFVTETDDFLWTHIVASVEREIAQGNLENTHMTVTDSLGNMAALDQWRASASVVYKEDVLAEKLQTARS